MGKYSDIFFSLENDSFWQPWCQTSSSHRLTKFWSHSPWSFMMTVSWWSVLADWPIVSRFFNPVVLVFFPVFTVLDQVSDLKKTPLVWKTADYVWTLFIQTSCRESSCDVLVLLLHKFLHAHIQGMPWDNTLTQHLSPKQQLANVNKGENHTPLSSGYPATLHITRKWGRGLVLYAEPTAN